MLRILILSVFMLIAVMLSVVILSVMVPYGAYLINVDAFTLALRRNKSLLKTVL
jgi:hypothetical protein